MSRRYSLFSMHRHPRMRASLLAAVMVMLVTLLTPTGAGAHAAYDSSDPGSGAVVAEAPTEITMRFTERLERSYSQMQLADRDGTVVEGTTLREGDDEYTMVLELPDTLPDGTWTVLWRTLSNDDGHPAQNWFTFTVGTDADVSVVAIPTGGTESGAPQALQTASRWAALVGLAAVIGAWPVWSAVVRPGLAPVRDRARPLIGAAMRFGVVAVALALAGSLFALIVQAMTLTDGSLSARVWETLTETRYGELWGLRIGLIVLAGLLMSWCAWWLPRRRSLASAGVWLVGLALPLPFSLISHAAAQPAGRAAAVTADVVHLYAASLWFGGLMVLAVVLFPALRGTDPERRRAVLRSVIPRFSVLGLATWAAMGVTGAYAGWLHVGSLDALRTTDYGRSLSLKIALLIVVLALAAANLLLIERRLRRAETDAVPVWTRRLRWTVTAELALVALALVAVGQMTSQQPAREALAEDATQIGIPFAVPEGEAELLLAPGTAGTNHFRLQVPSGAITDETEALLRITMPDRDDLGTRELRLARVSGDAFEHHGNELGIAGDWEFTVILRESGAAPVSAVAERAIGAAGADVTLPGDPPRFSGLGGVVGVLLVAGGLAGIVAVVYAGVGAIRREGGGMSTAALLLGGLLIVQAQIDPALATGDDIDLTDLAMVERGERIYVDACLSCHGAELRGDGPASAGMDPPAADFSAPHTMIHAEEDLVYWVRNGKQGTAMPGFDDVLSDQDIRAVLTYIAAAQVAFREPGAGGDGTGGEDDAGDA